MSEERIDKQKVKDYLDRGNPDLTAKMKDNLVRSGDWGDFKNALAERIVEYSKAPSAAAKENLYDFFSNFYLNSVFARESLDKILRGLRIREEERVSSRTKGKASISASKEAHLREIYESLGVPYTGDIIDAHEETIRAKEREKYGYVRPSKKREETSKEPEKKKDGKIKKAYYKLTSSMLIAPGRVPPEILQENRELLESGSQKLNIAIEELEKAKKIISSKNAARVTDIPDELQESYLAMSAEEMNEEILEEFEVTLEKEQRQQLETMRAGLEYLQKSKLETTLRDLVKSKFPTMPEQEVEQEIEYVMKDAKVNKSGELVLPKRSALREFMISDEGVLPEYKELAASIMTYHSVPKVSELSDEQIQKLAKSFSDAKEEMDPESKEYAVAEFFQKHATEMLPEDSEEKKRSIADIFKEHLLTKDLAEEAEIRHKIILSEEIKEQLAKAAEMVRRYDEKEGTKEGLNDSEVRRREIALKIAKKKVEGLKGSRLDQLIRKNETESRSVIEKAQEVLLPYLKATRDTGAKRLDKEFEHSEEDAKEPEEKD